MAKTIWILLFGVVIGVGVGRTLLGLIPARPAQQEQGKQRFAAFKVMARSFAILSAFRLL